MSPTPRRRRRVAVAGLLLVPIAALGASSCAVRPAPAPDPAPQRDREPASRAEVDPRTIVDGPDAVLSDLVVSADDPDVRAAVWRSCSTCESTRSRYALALTRDGFASRVVPDAVWRRPVVPHLAPDGSVLVVSYGAGTRLEVVTPDGELRDVDRTGSAGPAQPGEIVAGVDYHRSPTFYATDVVTAVAHPVEVPSGTQQLSQLDSGQLRALGRGGRYHWSDDGGATWQRADLPDQGFAGSLTSTVASGPETHAVVLGGDGATLFPFGFATRLEDDGTWTVFEGPSDPTAYLGEQVALPDGRLLVAAVAWSDQGTYKKPLTGTPSGLYLSEGTDWSSLRRVEVGAPFRRVERWQTDLLDVEVTGGTVALTVRGPDGSSAFRSVDLGTTWTELPSR